MDNYFNAVSKSVHYNLCITTYLFQNGSLCFVALKSGIHPLQLLECVPAMTISSRSPNPLRELLFAPQTWLSIDHYVHLPLMPFYCKKMQENFRVKGKKFYFGFVDLEKAFDRVPRKVI